MNNSQRRLVAWLMLIVVIIAFLPGLLSNASKQPQNIASYIENKADDVLALRDWMQKNNIDTISLLNKNSRSYEDGISVKTGKYYCFFEGAEDILDASHLDESAELFAYAFDLAGDAKEYGTYAYVRHDGVFEIDLSQDPFARLFGGNGTSIYRTDRPQQDLEAAGYRVSEDLGNGWYKAETQQEPLVIDTGSNVFLMIVAVVAVCVGCLIIFLLYKKHECAARVEEKHTEYIGLKPRIWWLIKGISRSYGRSYTVYIVAFVTDKDEKLSIYVPESEFHSIQEGETGRLEYKTLGQRIKFIRFTADTL